MNAQRTSRLALVAAGLTLAFSACTGSGFITTGEGGGGGDVNPDHMVGAGGRDVSEYWPNIDIPLSQNTRMLSFEMMRNEVERATGRSWVVGGVDQWEPNRGALGGADFETTFNNDLTPSQQRIVLWRKMAFQVCGDLVDAEAGAPSRTVFDQIDPGAPIDVTAPETVEQVRSLYHRFFLDDADAMDLTEGANLLSSLSASGNDGKGAWRGLCVAYLSSMRFLTY